MASARTDLIGETMAGVCGGSAGVASLESGRLRKRKNQRGWPRWFVNAGCDYLVLNIREAESA